MAIRQPDPTVLRCVALVAALTPALALTVVLSLFLVGGSLALRGPYVVQQSWPIVYGIQAILAATEAYGVVRFGPWLNERTLLTLVLAACVAELVVLLIIHPVLANELTPASTVLYWLMATGGPLQPVAAYVGGLLALRGTNS